MSAIRILNVLNKKKVCFKKFKRIRQLYIEYNNLINS